MGVPLINSSLPLLNFSLIWRGYKCPRFLKTWLDTAQFFNPKLVGIDDFNTESMLFAPHNSGSADGDDDTSISISMLDPLFNRYQDHQVKELAASLFPNARAPEAENLWQAEGETLRELGWIQAMDAPPRHPPEIHKDNWHSMLPTLSAVKNPSMMHFMIQSGADYLFHEGPDSWLMLLVRAGSRLKDSYIAEAELSRWVFAQKGIAVKRAYILLPRAEYERPIAPSLSFTIPEVDPREYFQIHSLNHAIKHMKESLSSALPRIITDASENKQCENTGHCDLCKDQKVPLPPHNIYTLHRGGKAVELLEHEEIFDLLDIEKASAAARSELKDRHHIQLTSIRTNQPYIDKPKLLTFLQTIQFPALFLDFESTSQAIPPVSAHAPWEHVPFMYSIHRMENQESDTAEIAQSSRVFLMDPNQAPSQQIRSFTEKLLADSAGAQTVLVYGAALEQATLGRLSKLFPDLSSKLLALRNRIIDMQTPFVHFWYYHPEQYGKLSLKKVLPLFSTENHAGLALQSGSEAHLNYYFLSHPDACVPAIQPQFAASAQAEWLENLTRYCAMDTFGVTKILRQLYQLAAST